jgi:hypothetical protein
MNTDHCNDEESCNFVDRRAKMKNNVILEDPDHPSECRGITLAHENGNSRDKFYKLQNSDDPQDPENFCHPNGSCVIVCRGST